MMNNFTGENKELWGFSLTLEEEPADEISKVEASVVQKIVEHSYESDIEIHFLPNATIPFVLIITPSRMWHYFTSKKDAEVFRKNILIDGYKPCWQFI
jgi:hypothetical protein